MTLLEQIKQNRRIWYNNMGQETRDFDALLQIIDMAINSCRDVTTLGKVCALRRSGALGRRITSTSGNTIRPQLRKGIRW